MTKKEFGKLISHTLKNYEVFSVTENKELIEISQVYSAPEISLKNKLPFFSWKRFFIPENEILFEFRDKETKEPDLFRRQKTNARPRALFGINHVDLSAILLYEKVFANDLYFQNQLKNTLIIGYSFIVEMPDKNQRIITEENIKNLRFDIYLTDICQKNKTSQKEFQVFAGSEKGMSVLEKINFKDYIFIKHIGQKYTPEWNKKMDLRRDKLKNFHNQKIWDKLGKICLECGKCTIACPTCFCFRIDDGPILPQDCGERTRCWDSCFYQEFSEVAGGHKFLNNTAQKIHFWYYHKFARIPDEFNMMGCVGCGRCHAVCPVEINIKKIMEEIEK